MGQKLGVLCLSVMAIAFAVGYSVNRNVSIRTNATAIEILKEIRSEKKTKCKYETDTVSDDFLSVGDSDISFKNIIDNNDKISQKEVTITLNSVIRGEEAQKEVDNFNSTNPISKIPKLVDASLEYVIIEYTITLPNNTKYTDQGQSSNVGIKICNLDGSTINTNNHNYSSRAINFQISRGLQSADSGVTKTVITLPKTITEFVVKLGDNPSDMCSYIIR